VASETARNSARTRPSPEKRLWNELRKLRWQAITFGDRRRLNKYIVDFACYAQRLIVEVDGISA